MATTDQWRTIEGWAEHLTGEGHDPTAACLLDLRRRVEAVEQRAASRSKSLRLKEQAEKELDDLRSDLKHLGYKFRASAITAAVEALEQRATPANEVISAHGCADVVLPAPAADRPLWEVMSQARYNSDGPRMGSVRLATAAEIDAVADWLAAREHCAAASALHAEARRAREGQ